MFNLIKQTISNIIISFLVLPNIALATDTLGFIPVIPDNPYELSKEEYEKILLDWNKSLCHSYEDFLYKEIFDKENEDPLYGIEF